MIPLPIYVVTSTLFTAWCSALIYTVDANAIVGFTLAAVNACAALLTGLATWRMSNKRRERNDKVLESSGDDRSGA